MHASATDIHFEHILCLFILFLTTSEHESPTLVIWDSRTKELFAHLIPATPGVKDDSTVAAVELLERRKCDPPSSGVFPTQPVHSKEEGGWPELIGTEHSQYQSLDDSLNFSH